MTLSGAGKTRSIVAPNLIQASGSYVVSDPKGNLYNKYKEYLERNDYIVKKLDFTNPDNSAHYNFFKYIRSIQDIVKVAHMLVYQGRNSRVTVDPFWDESSQLLIQSAISMLIEEKSIRARIFRGFWSCCPCVIQAVLWTGKRLLWM